VFGYDDERDGLRLVRWPGHIEHVEVCQERPRQCPIRRLDDHQRHARDLPFEVTADRRRALWVIGDEDSADVLVDRATDLDRLDGRTVETGDRDDHALLTDRRSDDEVRANGELLLRPGVLAV